MTNEEGIGLFAIAIGSAVSNAGGIGGGGLLVPILILILKFSTQEAIPLSKLMIFTGAITAFFMGLRNKHPHRNGIPLDLNVGGLLVPMLLFGTMVGVTLNKVMPQSIILICLTIVLIINTIKTLVKGVKLFRKENVEIEIAEEKKMKQLEGEEAVPLNKDNNEGDNDVKKDLEAGNNQNDQNDGNCGNDKTVKICEDVNASGDQTHNKTNKNG